MPIPAYLCDVWATMPKNRLQILYERPLVRPEAGGRNLPLEHLLKKEIQYHPCPPRAEEIDILEIGPGRGDFLFHLAQTNHGKKILGIEMGGLRYKKLVTRRDQFDLKNVFLIRGDARIPIHSSLRKLRLEKIFVLFPDPWPRNRHRHKRLLTPDFLKILCGLLKTGGEFTLATDVADYAIWVVEHFQHIPCMKNYFTGQEISSSLPDLIPTFFEEKWKKMGRVCRYVRFVKE